MPGGFNGPVRARQGLVACGLLLAAVYASIAVRSPERDALYGTILLQLAAAVLYLAAAAFGLGIPGVERRGRPYLVMLGFSVVFRALLVAAPPALSTDLWRYAWEGRVQAQLENPYRLPPSAKELEPLRDSLWEKVEHKDVPAVYGPLADLVVLGLVTQALHRRGVPSSLGLLYGWHPLPVVEVAGQGHLDALGVALLLLALDRAEKERPRLAGALMGLAAAVKFLPLVLLPALARRAGVRSALVALGVFAVTFVPYGLPRGLGKYATEWRFNATGLVLIEEALERTGLEERGALLLARGDRRLAHDTPYDKAPQRIVAGLLVAVAALGLAARARLESAAYFTIAAVVALSPVVHPWYLLWLLPFAVARRSLAVIVVALLAPLSYSVLLAYDGTQESWREESWPRVLLLSPMVVLLVWQNVPYGQRLRGAP